jgi:hypothetical protein
MFPAVGVNAAGKGAMSFSVVGKDLFPSAGYALLDAVNGAGPIVISGPGVAPDDGFSGYAPFATRGAARWGDYSAAASDEAGNIWMGSEMTRGGMAAVLSEMSFPCPHTPDGSARAHQLYPEELRDCPSTHAP